jgi:hypothetical protein
MRTTNIFAGLMAAIAATFSGLGYFRGQAQTAGHGTPSGAIAAAATTIPGRTFCLMTDVKDHCQEGQLAWFMPPRWGNEQLPIVFTAAVCDFRHPIVWTNGGVACIYTNVRRESPDPPEDRGKVP